MTHELSPAQYATSVGLTPETLERAGDEIRRLVTPQMTVCLCKACQESWHESVVAAMTVLGPAIREALVREMLADLKGTVVVYGDPKVELDHVIEWLARYLPANEEGAE